MISYIIILVGIFSAALGFFYSKDGQRNAVNGVGWVMALLLFAGGALNLYAEYHKREEAQAAVSQQRAQETKRKQIEQDAEQRRAVDAARQNWVALVQAANLDQKARVESANFFFEFPVSIDDDGPKSADGFVGPFPVLPKGRKARLVLMVGDAMMAEYEFEQRDPATIMLREVPGGKSYLVRDQEIVEVGGKAGEGFDGATLSAWWAQQEPMPSGFVYGTTLPVNVQLRRLINQMSTQTAFGYFEFAKVDLTPELRGRILKGLAASVPTYRISLAEGKGEDVCYTYLGLELKPHDAGVVASPEGERDVFEFALTPYSFAVETCNNDPF